MPAAREAGVHSREYRILLRRLESYTERLHTWEMRDAKEVKAPKEETVKILTKINEHMENVDALMRYSVSNPATPARCLLMIIDWVGTPRLF